MSTLKKLSLNPRGGSISSIKNYETARPMIPSNHDPHIIKKSMSLTQKDFPSITQHLHSYF